MKSVNPTKTMIVVAKSNTGISNDMIGECLGKTREAVSRINNQNPANWKLGMLKQYANILSIDVDDVCKAVKEYLEC